MSVPELVLGQPAAGAFAADGDARYYAVRVAIGQSIFVTLDDADNQGANDLYVRFGEMPSRSDYDGHTVAGSVADRRLQFTAPLTGYAYILAYSRQASASPAAFQITASLAQFSIGELVPASGGNVGRVTVAIRGAALPENAIPYLESADGQKIYGWPLQWTDASELYATFDLTGQPPGLYDLVLDRSDAPAAVLQNAFAVEVGTGPRLETNVIAPEEVRRGWLFPITVEWSNTGDTDMASPLLRLSNPAELDFSLDPFLESTFGSEVQFVGYSSTGPAGVLQPGDRESLTLYSLANSWVSRYDFTLSAIVEEWNNPQPKPINWAAIEPAYRPPYVPDDAAWAATWQLFTQDMGETWTDVVRRLADEVTQTGVAPDSLPLVADLMLDALTRAAGWSGQTTDAVPLYVQTGTPVEAADGSVSAVEVTFNQAIATTTFTADDVLMTAPDGTVLPVTVTSRSARLWRIEFAAPAAPGFFSLLIGPDITDPLDPQAGPGSGRTGGRGGGRPVRGGVPAGDTAGWEPQPAVGGHGGRAATGAVRQVHRDFVHAVRPAASQPTEVQLLHRQLQPSRRRKHADARAHSDGPRRAIHGRQAIEPHAVSPGFPADDGQGLPR